MNFEFESFEAAGERVNAMLGRNCPRNQPNREPDGNTQHQECYKCPFHKNIVASRTASFGRVCIISGQWEEFIPTHPLPPSKSLTSPRSRRNPKQTFTHPPIAC